MELKKYLEEGATKVGSLKELALYLGMKPQHVTNAKNGQRGIPAHCCALLADLTGRTYQEISIASELVTEKNEERRNILKKYAGGANALLLALVTAVTFIVTPRPADAATTPNVRTGSVYYVKS